MPIRLKPPRRRPAHRHVRKLFASKRTRKVIALTEAHDLRDGRYVLEFDHPSIDLMVYMGAHGTIAEWITAHGALIAMVQVGEA